MGGHLWLIGMMGSGKTAVGHELARRTNTMFADTDDVVAQRTGCSVATLWGSRGEQAFRDMEAVAVERLSAGTEPTVIATGGGAILRNSSVELMRTSGLVVWLTAAPAVLAERVGSAAGRPLLTGEPNEARLTELLAERRQLYDAAAHEEVATDALAVDQVADELERLWQDM